VVSTVHVNFAGAMVGREQDVVVENRSGADVRATPVVLRQKVPAFEFTTTCGELLYAGSSCVVRVRFAAEAKGSYEGVLWFRAEREHDVYLYGVRK